MDAAVTLVVLATDGCKDICVGLGKMHSVQIPHISAASMSIILNAGRAAL